MEETGLAAGTAQEMGQQSGVPGGTGQQISIEEVMQYLMQGITPEQLVQAGVPVELIEQAIAMLQQQMAAQGGGGQMPGTEPVPSANTNEQGLAVSAAGM